MEVTTQKMPIGIQDFEKLREGNYLYVDKTAFVHKMAESGCYYFLSRPRRFGKSLLTSTLHYYFEGRKDLFTGLAIDQLEQRWTVHPVLHFDLSNPKNIASDDLERVLIRKLRPYEEIYGRDTKEEKVGERLKGLIERAYEKTGERVVILIDEYDAPILEVLTDEQESEKVRKVMRDLYSPIKACDDIIRFVFITGISTFSQLSVFSELNNLKIITNVDTYASICGITMQELLDNFKNSIASLAKSKGCTTDKVIEMLRDQYDGYHFSKQMVDIFNPFSLLNAFSDNELMDYWFQSGTPTILLEMLKTRKKDWHFSIEDIEATKPVSLQRFNTSLELCTGPLPLLYQSGYLTIKGYDSNSELYTLGVPNTEVRVGLLMNLLPLYSDINTYDTLDASKAISAHLRSGNCDAAMSLIQELLSSIPFMRGDKNILGDVEKTEAYYHRLFFIIFKMLHRDVNAEVRSAKGAADIVVKTDSYIYVIEIKIDASADAALQQIEEKGYATPYLNTGKNVVKIGVNFSTEQRTLVEWKQA